MRRFTGLYEVLGLNPSQEHITTAEIKEAYKKAAKKWHPDKNGDSLESQEKMAEITHAYSILKDPKKRASYDQLGDTSDKVEQEPIVGAQILAEILGEVLCEQSPEKGLFEMLAGKSPQQNIPKYKDFSHSDLIEAIQKKLEQAELSVKTQKAEIETVAVSLQKLVDKLSYEPKKGKKGKGHTQAKKFDILGGMLRSKLTSAQGSLEKANEKLEEITALKEMLEHYSFDFTPPPPPSQESYRGFSGTRGINPHEIAEIMARQTRERDEHIRFKNPGKSYYRNDDDDFSKY